MSRCLLIRGGNRLAVTLSHLRHSDHRIYCGGGRGRSHRVLSSPKQRHMSMSGYHRLVGSEVRTPPILIHISNPTAFSGQGSVIVLELADEDAALKIAHQIAHETGRCVTVRDADEALIETIPAVSRLVSLARSPLASRANGPRRRDCRSGRACQALRTHTPSVRATADRDGPRRPTNYCRIAHRASWRHQTGHLGGLVAHRSIPPRRL